MDSSKAIKMSLFPERAHSWIGVSNDCKGIIQKRKKEKQSMAFVNNKTKIRQHWNDSSALPDRLPLYNQHRALEAV